MVFDFIRSDVAVLIYDKMRDSVLENLKEKKKITVIMPDAVNDKLREKCTEDLGNGGRGIGNQLEAWFVNPLSRALFDFDATEGSTVTVQDVGEDDQGPTVSLAS